MVLILHAPDRNAASQPGFCLGVPLKAWENLQVQNCYRRGLIKISIMVLRNIFLVSDTSNRPQHDIGSYLSYTPNGPRAPN